jgi:hypothetical protein
MNENRMIFKKYITFRLLFNSTKITLAIIICAFILCYAIQETGVHGNQTIKKINK